MTTTKDEVRGGRFRQVRERLGQSQEEFGGNVGARGQTIYRIEKGGLPSPKNLAAIASFARVSESWLQYGIEDGAEIVAEPRAGYRPSVETAAAIQSYLDGPLGEGCAEGGPVAALLRALDFGQIGVLSREPTQNEIHDARRMLEGNLARNPEAAAVPSPGWSTWPRLLRALGARPNISHLRLLAQLRPGKGYTPELADLLEWYAMLDQGFPPESLADSLATAEAGAREFAESGLARPDDLEESGGWSHK